MQSQKPKKSYFFWEILKYGKKNDVFTVITCFESQYDGSQLLVGGQCPYMTTVTIIGDEFTNPLNTCLTSAIFERQVNYFPISFDEALTILKKHNGAVYIKDKESKQFSLFTQYSVFGRAFNRLSDLMTTEFYVNDVDYLKLCKSSSDVSHF